MLTLDNPLEGAFDTGLDRSVVGVTTDGSDCPPLEAIGTSSLAREDVEITSVSVPIIGIGSTKELEYTFGKGIIAAGEAVVKLEEGNCESEQSEAKVGEGSRQLSNHK